MERNANYALVGLSTLILTVALIVFVVWLARVRINAEYDLYDIVFQGPVRGLNEGGEVHFNGIKVGEVTKIALDKFNPRNVIARVRVTEDVPIRVDSYATLEPQGITGLNYVQITAGTGTRQLLKEADKPRCERLGLGRDCIPVIRSQRSAISDLLEGGGTVLTRTIEALDPELLFLDEPTSGLDPIGAAAFDELIRDLADSLDLTVFMITHDLDSLYEITDRVAVLADKRVVATAPVHELERSDHPWIREYFLGPRGRAARDARTGTND